MSDELTPGRDWSALEKLACLLLFGSGLAALTYQTVWMREFRLVFGASTAATAAVSALFMAGLGVGGWLLGPRADRSPRPLLMYARLELAISALAALSPLLLWLTRKIYLASGGMMVLGMTGATVARLLLAAIVVGFPAFLMGGTLPAAVRAATSAQDGARRSLGSLYGVNTLGALAGVLLTTFVALERFGARSTLFLAVAVNLLVAVSALRAGAGQPAIASAAGPDEKPASAAAGDSGSGGLFPCLALAGAAGVGFAFFLMELVWYRMLAPVLGGSTYTFGLILAVALAGIGLGGAAYPVIMRDRRPGIGLLAATCLLEALFLLLPYAVGDWVASITVQILPLSALGFAGIVGAWLLVTMGVVFPAAFISGVQFPLLIALLGRGSADIGRQTGRAYALNTLGAIAGSLAGGFGLIPWLSAPGCWLLVGALLSLLGLLFAASAWLGSSGESHRHRRFTAVATAALAVLLVLCLLAQGPTAAWRHSPIGAGRTKAAASLEEVRIARSVRRWSLKWEADGVESAVGIMGDQGLAFLVNGKSDGNVIGDRGTQIMCGMIGAALHGAPKKAMVVGLGTGCTAGWLAEVEGMERVDVVELEPAVLNMAEMCAPANRGVLEKNTDGGKVRVIINDAREVLNTIPEQYDLIVSEPSNPYRAGIASLFTREFYREVKGRLAPGGLFVSWCQAYEIDTETVFTILATQKTVFPYVECWATQSHDLAFIASDQPIRPDPEALSARLREPAFRDAMRIGWGMEDLDGFLGRFIATDEYVTRAVEAGHAGDINTDDLMRVEYDYARTVGRNTNFSIHNLGASAQAHGQSLPAWLPENADRERIILNQGLAGPFEGASTSVPGGAPAEVAERLRRMELWRLGQFAQVLQSPLAVVKPPHRMENLAMAEALAWNSQDAALTHVSAFEGWWPATAAFVKARLAMGRQDMETAVAELEKACRLLRRSPWEVQTAIDRGLDIIGGVAKLRPEYAGRLYEAMLEPFALSYLESKRCSELINISLLLSVEKQEAVLLRWVEPHPLVNFDVLAMRARVYTETGNPLAEKALDEFDAFLAGRRKTVAEFVQGYGMGAGVGSGGGGAVTP